MVFKRCENGKIWEIQRYEITLINTHMKEKTYALNICLIPSQELYDICLELNKLDTNSRYNENSRPFIPHITLGMKTLNNKQIENIILDFNVLDAVKASSEVLNYYSKEFSPWDIWSWIYIEKNPYLAKLQKDTLEITKKYNSQTRNKSSYAIDEFFEENEIQFFTEDEYIERDELHITLWKTDIQSHIDMSKIPSKTIFDTLVIWHMWNYGSVREILYSKKLV